MDLHILRIMAFCTAGWIVAAPECHAATFSFGSSQNNLNGLESKTLSAGGFSMLLQTGIAGTELNEPQGAGLGVNSTSVVGTDDPNAALFNVIGGSGPLAGTGERIRISFDQPGILSGLNFDGVKDESLEYFILDTPGGTRYNFFDSAANTTIPGAIDSAISAGVLTGNVIYLLEINTQIDDEAQGLHIPFAAGQQFTLRYGELGPQFHPLLAGNGARLQGITVESVPEPSTMPLLMLGAAVGLMATSFGRLRRINR